MADNDLDRLMEGIAHQESGGNYGALGPQTKSGDRAYGKYQVMGANVPQWTREVLGKSLTPEEFRADHDAQEAVARSKLGTYAAKYGTQGAAAMWFSGSPNTHSAATDVNRMSVSQYVANTAGGAISVNASPRSSHASHASHGHMAARHGQHSSQAAVRPPKPQANGRMFATPAGGDSVPFVVTTTITVTHPGVNHLLKKRAGRYSHDNWFHGHFAGGAEEWQKPHAFPPPNLTEPGERNWDFDFIGPPTFDPRKGPQNLDPNDPRSHEYESPGGGSQRAPQVDI